MNTELARRLASCEQWKGRKVQPGEAVVEPNGDVWRARGLCYSDGVVWVLESVTDSLETNRPTRPTANAVPDLDDPATRGVLFFMLRGNAPGPVEWLECQIAINDRHPPTVFSANSDGEALALALLVVL
jgi:hypothetical protein